eukprot:scaffold52606_cov21-Tisochrysis_lutea.AAC.5
MALYTQQRQDRQPSITSFGKRACKQSYPVLTKRDAPHEFARTARACKHSTNREALQQFRRRYCMWHPLACAA